MSAFLDTLLADRDRMEFAASRKGDGPIKSVLRVIEPVSRADKIIAAGNLARTKYRALNPTADSAMIYGAQIGHLHGEARQLCNELESFDNPTAAPAGEEWEHIDVRANGDLGGALVRCFFCEDGYGDIDLCAVFLRGVELTVALTPEAFQALEKAMRDERVVYAEEQNLNAAISRVEA